MDFNSAGLKKLGFFRYRQLNGSGYILTNEVGDYCLLDSGSLDLLLSGDLQRLTSQKYDELRNFGIIRDRHSLDRLARKFASKNYFLERGTSLHIVVVTLRCDHKCTYCQSNSRGLREKQFDMDKETARCVVDRIFESPNRDIIIEFQGGEPLVNLETLKFIVEYAKDKNVRANKNLAITIVSNLSFMNKQILRYFMDNDVAVCTSLDGPEHVHNRNRVASGARNSHRNTVKWIKTINAEYKKHKLYHRMNSLATLTKFSLKYPREIVDEYVRLGFKEMHLRPVSPFGNSRRLWRKLGYPADGFIGFYKKAMDYIIELNLKGNAFLERTAAVFLKKIITDRDPNFLDLRSPCGAVIGQLAYYVNGDVYTCDEGRMLASMGDDNFKVGNVFEHTFRDFFDNPVTKAMCVASYLDDLPGCSDCAYNPYCGICPLYNYFAEGNIFSQAANSRTCRINSAVLDYIFEKLQDKRIREEVFLKWVER
ncbi:MAG: His-Xaa-Ser system radical SAM maturase HxsB [Candidatus Omnitrophica bacterium]|nr:His-Xaa-Ser system radical SAM maturase HxsB [Candidatus Omnitrophota bacterium]